MRVSEEFAKVHLIEPANYGSAGVDSDSVNMGRLNHLSACLMFGALVGNSVLKVYSGASAGAKTTALAFKCRVTSADYKAANADQLGAFTSVTAAGLTLTAASFDHRMVHIGIDADQMPEGEKWLTIELDATATTLNVAADGTGWPRYPGNTIPTVL